MYLICLRRQVTVSPSQKINSSTLAHLTPDQQQELLQLLDKYADHFSDTPGLTTRVEHCVQLMPGFKPKHIRAYKVPEKLQSEVECQLEKMLANGIIRESNSPMASPLVCVLKGKGCCDGVRLAVDYRYVNQFTVSDAFPIPDIEDAIQRIGGKRFVSACDCKSGYYQTAMREEDKWLTASRTTVRIQANSIQNAKCWPNLRPRDAGYLAFVNRICGHR